MQIEITTPDKTVFEGQCSLVQLPGVDGLFEILENHAPMIALLGNGKLKLKDDSNKYQYFDINGGVLEVKDNFVKVLAE
ncbi:MAG: ATP synthase F1 subunit epsilon [Bacteroidota bacterium]